ncbi:MAG: MBL fold metallo-hydrolase [bacterium]|nr:MBL fold metallo-hydrolase [bacterium]
MKSRVLPLVLLILFLCTGSAFAKTVAGLPLHVEKFESGAIRLWIGDHISSTAVVAVPTSRGILVIDTFGVPEVDRELRSAIARELGRDDFTFLINTHEHGDHTGGNAVYADCTIVGHELVPENMQRDPADRERTIRWRTTRISELETEIAAMAADAPERARRDEDLILARLLLANAQADNAPPPPPTRVFADRMELDLGDVTVEMFYIGGMHTASDIAVLIPKHGLLLTGDTMADVWLTDTPGCLASFSARSGIAHDFPRWMKNWNHLLDRKDEYHTLLPGHWNGELSHAGAEARVRYVEALWNAAEQKAAAGGRVEDLQAENRLADRFPHLAESPGFAEWTNAGTALEIWCCMTGMESGAQALYALIENGADEAEIRAVVDQKSAASPKYFFVEAAINQLGYRFLNQEQPEQAARLLQANVEMYPESWNTYDSLGEALLATGDREGAIANYEKSVELNPDNTSGTDALARIRGSELAN